MHTARLIYKDLDSILSNNCVAINHRMNMYLNRLFLMPTYYNIVTRKTVKSIATFFSILINNVYSVFVIQKDKFRIAPIQEKMKNHVSIH